jgi:hypothetical protein
MPDLNHKATVTITVTAFTQSPFEDLQPLSNVLERINAEVEKITGGE